MKTVKKNAVKKIYGKPDLNWLRYGREKNNIFSCAVIHTQYFLVLFPLGGNYFLWHDIISLGRKLFPLTGNFIENIETRMFILNSNVILIPAIVNKLISLFGNYLKILNNYFITETSQTESSISDL